MSEETTREFVDRFAEAENLFRQNRISESLKKYSALLNEQPNHISVLNNMGLAYEKLGELDQAINFYQRCHGLKPGMVIFIHNLANAYSRENRWNDALPLMEQIIKTNFDREKNAEKYALCLFNLGQREQMTAFVKKALVRFPDNQRLHRLLGRALLHGNAHVDGLKHLQIGSGLIEFDSNGVTYPS